MHIRSGRYAWIKHNVLNLDPRISSQQNAGPNRNLYEKLLMTIYGIEGVFFRFARAFDLDHAR